MFYNAPDDDILCQSLDFFVHVSEPLKDSLGVAWCTGSGYCVRRAALTDIGNFPVSMPYKSPKDPNVNSTGVLQKMSAFPPCCSERAGDVRTYMNPCSGVRFRTLLKAISNSERDG